ncbi:unnamed protein product [Microthlaspi erraticum]|uniref:Uncharacterized protein n=1 Tax=Microthlaspi erraticum TaxID=1685480 RepID=A0A6D2I976_9BRAS|nr:unnamed protein product [Microthlaspi erraticum]
MEMEKKRSYSQKSEDCSRRLYRESAPKPRSPAGRGTNVPRSAKLSVRLKSRPKSKTVRPITQHDPGNIARGRPSQTLTPRRARSRRASRETKPRGRATRSAYHGRCIRPSREERPTSGQRISSAKSLSLDHAADRKSVRPRPFRLGPRPDCPADRPDRPSQRRGRPEALFEAQTYVFKPGLTLAASRKT